MKTALWPLAKLPLPKVGAMLQVQLEQRGLYPLCMAHIASKDGPGALFVVFGESTDTVAAAASPAASPGAAAEAPAGVAASAAPNDAPAAFTSTVEITPPPVATVGVDKANGSELGEPEVISQ